MPPIFRALFSVETLITSVKHFEFKITTYPASDPPTHGIAAGVNAGPLPAVPAAEAVGDGLLTIATYGARGRRVPYGSKDGRGGLLRLEATRSGSLGGGRVKARISSSCNLGMNPGSIAVPPTTKIDDTKVRRRSTGTCSHQTETNDHSYVYREGLIITHL